MRASMSDRSERSGLEELVDLFAGVTVDADDEGPLSPELGGGFPSDPRCDSRDDDGLAGERHPRALLREAKPSGL